MGGTVRFTLILAASLLLTACSFRDAELSRQVAGTWKEGLRGGVIVTSTMSPNGGFSDSLSQSNFVALTSQGTWLVTNGELIITCTNGQGTTRTGQRFVDPLSWVHRYKIIHLDAHRLIGERDGNTNFWSR